MAKDKKRRSGGAFAAGVIITLLAALGIGEFGIGNYDGGLISDIFKPAEEVVVDDADEGLYYAEIMVVDNVVTLDGKEVTVDELKAELADAKDKRVLLIDGGATHTAWQEVIDALDALDCVVETTKE
ncbi:MAG: hypothetical protein AB1Z23_09960 [Eubacteriales bacterium]